jgi:hypothetical protein
MDGFARVACFVTAADFAALLDARPVGACKWMARCPAHRDRNPSLSIGEGRQGRVILNCFASCQLSSILTAMQLRLRDLFSTEPPSPAQRRAIEAQRRREQMAGRRIGEAAEHARQLEDHVSRLGAVIRKACTSQNSFTKRALPRIWRMCAGTK